MHYTWLHIKLEHVHVISHTMQDCLFTSEATETFVKSSLRLAVYVYSESSAMHDLNATHTDHVASHRGIRLFIIQLRLQQLFSLTASAFPNPVSRRWLQKWDLLQKWEFPFQLSERNLDSKWKMVERKNFLYCINAVGLEWLFIERASPCEVWS